MTAGAGPSKGEHRDGRINVVLFGETGVGKSSVINLIAGEDIAIISSGVDGCTMQATQYDIRIEGREFSIFDTIGLNVPEIGVQDYLTAIEMAHQLIVKLSAAGGIHLLLFCLRAGRITRTTLCNYRLFREALCSARVPIALVFTGLEREAEMEDWWRREKGYLARFGLKNDGHACITAVRGNTPGHSTKYTESRGKIRELLKNCALQSGAFLPESHTWFAKFAKGLKSIAGRQRDLKRKDLMKVLTSRCDFDLSSARRITQMVEEADNEAMQGGYRTS